MLTEIFVVECHALKPVELTSAFAVPHDAAHPFVSENAADPGYLWLIVQIFGGRGKQV